MGLMCLARISLHPVADRRQRRTHGRLHTSQQFHPVAAQVDTAPLLRVWGSLAHDAPPQQPVVAHWLDRVWPVEIHTAGLGRPPIAIVTQDDGRRLRYTRIASLGSCYQLWVHWGPQQIAGDGMVVRSKVRFRGK